MSELFSKIKIVVAFIKLFRDPNDTKAVFKIANELRSKKNAGTARMQERAMSDANFKSLYESKYQIGAIDVQALNRLPENTLGYGFSKHMIDGKLEVNFYPNIEVKNPLDYWTLRMRQNHDIWHVLTGFDTSVTGELGLQAFSLAQTESLFSAVILAGGILGTVSKRPTELLAVFDSIHRGYALGKKCKYLPGVKLDTMWTRSIQEIRADLGL